jgi:hypothetical protein
MRETVAAVSAASELFGIGRVECGTCTASWDVHVASVIVESIRFRTHRLVISLTRMVSAH